MTISRNTVSVALFLVFILISAVPVDPIGLELAKNGLALVVGAASCVIAIQVKRSAQAADVRWIQLVGIPTLLVAQSVGLAGKYQIIPETWPGSSAPYVLILGPIIVAAFVDLVNLVGQASGKSRNAPGQSHGEQTTVGPKVSGEGQERT